MDQYKDSLVQYIVEWINTKTVWFNISTNGSIQRQFGSVYCRMDQYKDSLVQYIVEPKQYHASLVQYIDEPKQYHASCSV